MPAIVAGIHLIHIETDVAMQQARCLYVDWEDQRLQCSHRMEERGNPMSQHSYCRIGSDCNPRAFTMVDLLVVMVILMGLLLLGVASLQQVPIQGQSEATPQVQSQKLPKEL